MAKTPITKGERVEFLDTGSTLLNLAASQKGIDGGWARGRIINIVGDGSSGKTLLALEACAHAFYNMLGRKSSLFPEVKEVFIVYNNVEGVMDFPIEDMYGEEFNKGVEWTRTSIAEDFGIDYQKRVNQLKKGQFLLYVVDSLDALVAEAQAERTEKLLKGKGLEGSYGVEKAKYFSSGFFSHLCELMEGKDATLICISQVREKIGVVFGEKHYRTGGKALNFYTHQVCWLAHTGKLEKTFRGKKRAYGITVKANFKRSKVAKPFRTADFPILFDYGIDDISSMLDYLFTGKKYDEGIPWGDKKFDRTDLITLLEDSPAELTKLKKMVEEDWIEVETAITPQRKSRFKKGGA